MKCRSGQARRPNPVRPHDGSHMCRRLWTKPRGVTVMGSRRHWISRVRFERRRRRFRRDRVDGMDRRRVARLRRFWSIPVIVALDARTQRSVLTHVCDAIAGIARATARSGAASCLRMSSKVQRQCVAARGSPRHHRAHGETYRIRNRAESSRYPCRYLSLGYAMLAMIWRRGAKPKRWLDAGDRWNSAPAGMLCRWAVRGSDMARI